MRMRGFLTTSCGMLTAHGFLLVPKKDSCADWSRHRSYFLYQRMIPVLTGPDTDPTRMEVERNKVFVLAF
jgi:hypothetical protein